MVKLILAFISKIRQIRNNSIESKQEDYQE